jgi:putative transposase
MKARSSKPEPSRSGRGGARPGAGRPRKHPLPVGWPRGRKFVPHLRRAVIARDRPVRVTLLLQRVAPTLRRPPLLAAVHGAVHAGRARPGFRVVGGAIERDHIELLVEADGRPALARGMQGLTIRMARALNNALGRSGKLFADRYQVAELPSAAALRRAQKELAELAAPPERAPARPRRAAARR